MKILKDFDRKQEELDAHTELLRRQIPPKGESGKPFSASEKERIATLLDDWRHPKREPERPPRAIDEGAQTSSEPAASTLRPRTLRRTTTLIENGEQ